MKMFLNYATFDKTCRLYAIKQTKTFFLCCLMLLIIAADAMRGYLHYC